VLLLGVWLVYPAGRRWHAAAIGGITLIAGMAGGLAPLRTATGFFAVVIVWALLSGAVELIAGSLGLRGRTSRREIVPGIADARPAAPVAPRSESRDAVVVGAVTMLLGAVLLFVQPGYALDYTVDEAGQTFTLTGVIIGVGIFGGYAAIVAVYLGIAGFSPRPAGADAVTEAPAPADQKDSA
jgi:uncharacterized membrane protein HdeD (DUF308 family)